MNAPALVEVHPDADALATAVAGALVARLADAQERGEVPHVCLTGGTIADAVHRELARLGSDHGVDWSRVEFWWGDERFVPADDPERNAGQARRAFLDTVGTRADLVHEIGSSEEYDDVDAAATAYAQELREHGGDTFEVLILGVGPDGHVASLFPGSPHLDAEGIAVGVTDSPKPPARRVSLTLGSLNRSRAVWFLAAGEEKSAAVARAQTDGTDVHDVPAAGVAGREETVWFLDRAAASRL